MGAEILLVSFALMFIGPLLGLVLGGFMRASRLAHRLMIGACVVFNLPFIIWFFTRYEHRHLIPVLGIIALNLTLIVVPYIVFTRIFKRPTGPR